MAARLMKLTRVSVIHCTYFPFFIAKYNDSLAFPVFALSTPFSFMCACFNKSMHLLKTRHEGQLKTFVLNACVSG